MEKVHSVLREGVCVETGVARQEIPTCGRKVELLTSKGSAAVASIELIFVFCAFTLISKLIIGLFGLVISEKRHFVNILQDRKYRPQKNHGIISSVSVFVRLRYNFHPPPFK